MEQINTDKIIKECYTPVPLELALTRPALLEVYSCNEEQYNNSGTRCYDLCEKVWDVVKCRKVRITIEDCK